VQRLDSTNTHPLVPNAYMWVVLHFRRGGAPRGGHRSWAVGGIFLQCSGLIKSILRRRVRWADPWSGWILQREREKSVTFKRDDVLQTKKEKAVSFYLVRNIHD